MPARSSGSVRVFYPRFDRTQIVAALRAGVERLGDVLPLRRVVLFGSYAKGTYTVASDIDLLVVYGGEPRADAYALTRRVLNIPRLEPHLYTEVEYDRVSATLERMIEGGITIMVRPRSSGFARRSPDA